MSVFELFRFDCITVLYINIKNIQILRGVLRMFESQTLNIIIDVNFCGKHKIYSVMQSIEIVIADSVKMAFSDEDNIFGQIYGSEYNQTFIIEI